MYVYIRQTSQMMLLRYKSLNDDAHFSSEIFQLF